MLDINSQFFFRQIADMSEAGFDDIILTQKFFNRFCFSRRLHDHQILLHTIPIYYRQDRDLRVSAPAILLNNRFIIKTQKPKDCNL